MSPSGASSALWSRLESDFDAEDETANFGTRLAIEAADGNAMYDVVTVATCEPQSPAEAEPVVTSAATAVRDLHLLAVAIDSCLHVIKTSEELDEEDFQPVSVVFSAPIECLCWSPCGRFVVAGLCSGMVQMLHLPSKRPLPPIAIDHGVSNEDGSRCYVGCKMGSSGVRFVGRNGVVYGINDLDLNALHCALDSANLANVKAVQDAMEFTTALLSDEPLAYYSGESDLVASAKFIGRVSEEDSSIGDILPFEVQSVVKVEVPNKCRRNVIFCLDTEGQIYTVCRRTMMIRRVWKERNVRDFVLMEEEGEGRKLRLLMTVEGTKMDPNQLVLQLREFPSFDLLYELDVTRHLWLLHCCPNQETPHFMEGSSNAENENKPGSDVVQFLRVRGICESVLEARLERLVRRQKFEEAEKFARQYKLPVEPVHRGKFAWIMEKLSPWRKDPFGEGEEDDLMKELKRTLGKFDDLAYLVECCVTAAVPKLSQLRSLLHLARDTIRNNAKMDDVVGFDLMVRVSRALKRLKTFTLCFPENQSGSIDEWISFSRADLCVECKKLLKLGKEREAVLVWNRHKVEFIDYMNCESVREFLDLVPSSEWKIEPRLRWLSHFLPDCLKVYPDALPVISAWASEAARAYETERRSWPSNGLRFAEGVLNALSFDSDGGGDALRTSRAHQMLNQQRSDPTSELHRLIGLIESLKDLDTLHKRFRLHVKLAEFLTEDKSEVIATLLDWCTESAEITNLVENFLLDYLRRCPGHLESGRIFAEYLGHLVSSSEFSWHWYIGDAPWEPKAKALLPFITSLEDKAECILEIVKCAPVPWSATITQICSVGIALDHPTARLIREQETMVGLKQILKRYECRNLGLKGRELTRLLQFIISKGGRSQGYSDALEVARTSPGLQERDAHHFYVKHLIRVEEDAAAALEIYSGLDEGTAKWSAARLMSWAEVWMTTDPSQVSDSLVCCLSGLERRVMAGSNSDFSERLQLLKRKVSLFNEFGIRVGKRSNTEHVDNFLGDKLQKHKIDSISLSAAYNGVLRLADLLGMSRERALSRLLLVPSVTAQELEMAISVIRNMERWEGFDDFMAEMNAQLVRVAQGDLMGSVKCDARLPEVLSILASQNAVHCSESNLRSSIEAARWQRLFKEIADRFHAEDALHASDASAAVDVRAVTANVWPAYKDRGLPIAGRTLGDVFDCATAAMDVSENGFSTRLAESGQRLAGELEASANLQLAILVRLHVADLLHLSSATQEDDAAEILSAGITQKVQVSSMVTKVLGDKRPDFNFALACLLDDPNALPSLARVHSAVGQDYGKLFALSRLGLKFCQKKSLLPPMESFKDLLIKSSWGRVVSGELKLSFKEGFGGGHSELEAVFQAMVDQPQHLRSCSVGNLVRFCRDFSLDTGARMLQYATTTLSKLEPCLDKDGGVAKPSGFQQVIGKVSEALKQVDNPAAVNGALMTMFEKVSPYNYEVLGFVIERLDDAEANGGELVRRASQILGFLLEYERVAEPGEDEVDFWLESTASQRPFPKAVARRRLPLSWLVTVPPKKKYRILKREFTLDSYKLWSNIAGVMKLQPDNICVFTVQNALSGKDLEHSEDEGEWSMSHVDSPLLQRVKTCIDSITDLKKAASASHYVVNHIRGGADRVLAAQMSLQVAIRWHAQDHSPDSESTLEHATSRLAQLKAEEALRRRGLEEDHLLELIHSGAFEELIVKLYEHPSITARSKRAGHFYPDINGAVRDISEWTRSIADIKFSLLERWLPDADSSENEMAAALEETISNFKLDFKRVAAKEDANPGCEEEDANFIRCVYICQDGEALELIMSHLLQIGFSRGRAYPTTHKLRALRCLLSVASDGELRQKTSRSAEEVRSHLESLQFSSRLQALNLPYDDETTFADASKSSLVESVLRSCGHLRQGISLAVDLCVSEGIFQPSSLWTGLLERMASLSMERELAAALDVLNRQPHLWHSDAFRGAWNFVLLRPFETAGAPPLAESQALHCERAVRMLDSCPLAPSELNLKQMHGECRRLGLTNLAENVFAHLEDD